jgi:hypothetical protein
LRREYEFCIGVACDRVEEELERMGKVRADPVDRNLRSLASHDAEIRQASIYDGGVRICARNV